MTVLVIAEHNNQSLQASTLNAISASTILNADVKVLVAGYKCESVAKELENVAGVNEILLADDICYQHPLAESLAPLIVELAKDFTHIFAPATTFGKNIMPRVAALLNVAQISDIIDIKNAKTYCRPIYAGNAIATVESNDPIQIITVRPTAFAAAEKSNANNKIIHIDFKVDNQQSSFIGEESQRGNRPDLSSAEIVISGGRGLKNKETFERLFAIADRMGAAIGASRAAVDAGLVSNDLQVGQTGKVVAPKLYIAVGISGAIQHLAGMKDSKIIVAINKDPDAPIFQIADYGLVADLNEVLPQWEEELTKLGY